VVWRGQVLGDNPRPGGFIAAVIPSGWERVVETN
jgi:hypothetical protein